MNYLKILNEQNKPFPSFSLFRNTIRRISLFYIIFNVFVPNPPFLYPPKTSDNLMVFWCFQGVEKGWIGNKWVDENSFTIRKHYVRRFVRFSTKLHKSNTPMWVFFTFFKMYFGYQIAQSITCNYPWKRIFSTMQIRKMKCIL